MVYRRPAQKLFFVVLFSLLLFYTSCGSRDNQSGLNPTNGTACAILAHPDDETIISGTLALLKDQGFGITVIYITSGDDGPDETGRGLYGPELAVVREAEANEALRNLGIKDPPVFLKYPDGHVQENEDAIKQAVKVILEELKPQIVIGFGPDGITGDMDHIGSGKATDSAFDETSSGKLLLHMAITRPLSPYYAHGVPVPESMVDLQVKVKSYRHQRIQAVEAHKTQFSQGTRTAYKLYVRTMRKEKFIIARNKGADELIESCF